jgi:hypothetical protein
MMSINNLLICSIFLFSLASHSEMRSSLTTENLNFLSPDYTAENKNFLFVGAHVRNIKKDAFNLDFKGAYAVGKSVLSYMNFKEAYYTYQVSDQSFVHVGRKVQDWSAIDSYWNFGVFQPQFRWNQLAPESQGLTGLYWNQKISSHEINLFATPLYIPDQGASYELKDGQFQSGNPFFQPPPQTIKFQNQLLPIDYDIKRPETNDIIFQSQLGAQYKFISQNGFFGNIAAIYKPSNQLALGYKGVLVTTRVRIDITPKTYLEKAYAADFGYKQDWGQIMISALHSDPQSPEFDSTFNAPKFKAGTSIGPQVQYKFSNFKLLFSHVETSGGQVVDEGPDASTERASLSERFLFKQSTMLGLKYKQIFSKKLLIDSDLNFQFSSKEAFRKISFKNRFDIKGPWAAWINLILIDTDSNKEPVSGYEPYKNLDQIWAGVSYDL